MRAFLHTILQFSEKRPVLFFLMALPTAMSTNVAAGFLVMILSRLLVETFGIGGEGQDYIFLVLFLAVIAVPWVVTMILGYLMTEFFWDIFFLTRLIGLGGRPLSKRLLRATYTGKKQDTTEVGGGDGKQN